ncbi:hypothetical protein AYL99_04573 [Fonsecaea erecta]|uniref:Uncharacterized protein n=1 Tax=Fonsecaea erecta TaxID=1367422 RepID=A0A178ZRD2_9EURO|nr:hypothetical protein AYL99_04573 [Fonsecaea erecta]OAP62370.1 hypothetical protein AYL99_04573 [Fonsecaea erecta]
MAEPQPEPRLRPQPPAMDASSEYDSAAESYAPSKVSIECCPVCGYAGYDSRQHRSSRGRRRRHHQCGASPVELLISGMTQTMRSLQAVSEQERMMRERQAETRKDPHPRLERSNDDDEDDGKDSESNRETDGESETGSESRSANAHAHAHALAATGKYEQFLLDKHDLPGYQTAMAGT